MDAIRHGLHTGTYQPAANATPRGDIDLMIAQNGSRTLAALAGLAVCAAAGAVLSGCQSDQDQRLAEARELLRQKQAAGPLQSAPSTAVPARAAQPVAGPIPPAGRDDLGMPFYPGGKRITLGAGDAAALDSGLAMALIETRDPVDTVISYYRDRIKSPDARLAPTVTEEQRDGHRVVRLSAPQTDGGLQTVEAREEGGKTTIQLMNLKGTGDGSTPAHGPVPSSIPGVPAFGTPAEGKTPLVSPHDLTVPSHGTPR
jgi:hypothetical protein